MEKLDSPRETINHPRHYQGCSPATRSIVMSFGIAESELDGECINALEAHKLNFCQGNAVKYLWRYGKKSGSRNTEDLEKAKFYVDRLFLQSYDFNWDAIGEDIKRLIEKERSNL